MAVTDNAYDVAVVGGGLCGFAAARTCALAGLKILVIEPRQVLGWESTWAFALDFASGGSGMAKSAAGAGGSETVKWLAEAARRAGASRDGRLDAPVLEMLLDQELARSGAGLLLYAQPVALAVDEDGVAGVAVGSKSGEVTIRATTFIDATENALLWRLAGGDVAPAETEGVFAAFINGVQPMALPMAVRPGNAARRIELKAGVWPGEVAAEFVLPAADVRAFRRALPDVIRCVRDQRSEFTDAIVTHVSVEPLSLQPVVSVASAGPTHPEARNLFAAGVWASPPSAKPAAIRRLDLGEEAGKSVVRAFPGFARRSRPTPVPSSIVSPPIHETDVLVCGGGTAGAIAAIAAGRQGVKTTLLEASTFLGGIAAGGGIHVYYHGIVGGIQDEVDRRVEQMTPLFSPPGKVCGFHPEVRKVVLQQMAEEAGVELVFQTTITGTETEDMPTRLPAKGTERPSRRLRSVVVAGPGGAATYRAEAFVDSTGDGDVAYMAGAPFTYGRETDNLPHAYSLSGGRLNPKGAQAVINFDAGYCDPTDIEDLTRARRRGLQHYRKDAYTPANRLVYIAPLIGLRNSRQIVGEYRLTLLDEILSREFPDVIAYARSHFDNHGYDYENESDEAMLWVWMLWSWRKYIGCEVPYRCLVPLEVEGLLVACRAISITHDAHNQLRMQRDMQRVGEAAGVAAAMAAKTGVLPRNLPVAEIQEKLLQSGALGVRQPKQLPAGEKPSIHDPECLPARLPDRTIEECVKALEGTEARTATWQLCLTGKDAVPTLLDLAERGNKDQRFWASVVLAMNRREEAVPALLECVKERRSDLPPNPAKEAPMWMPAMVLLGRVGDPKAVPALSEALLDSRSSLDALIAAVRALGRIGDPAGVPAIEKMLARADLPVTRMLRKGSDVFADVVEDCRWQLELAAAETLAKLGVLRPDLVQRHLLDSRACVRRYAEKVQRFIQEKKRAK